MGTNDDLPAPAEGLVLTHFSTVRDVAAARRFHVAALSHEAVGEHPHGRVLVLSSGGHPEASHGGGITLSRGEPSRGRDQERAWRGVRPVNRPARHTTPEAA